MRAALDVDALAARAAGGDEAAVGALLVAFAPLIRHCAGRIRRQAPGVEPAEALAEMHAAFLELLAGFDASRGVFFACYAERVLAGAARTYVRREGVRAARYITGSDLGGQGFDDTGSSPDSDDTGRQAQAHARAWIEDALARLPAEQREVMTDVLDDIPLREIAARRGMTLAAVERRKAAAVARLQRMWDA